MPKGVYPRDKEDLNPQAEEVISPSAISTPKEAQLDDTVRVLQKQIAELTQAIGQISRKTGSTIRLTERNGDAFGFIRAFDEKPIVGWKTKPGSYSALNQFGQEIDEQYIQVQYSDGSWSEQMHYQKFDQITKLNQISVKILDYCQKNDLGEWKPKRMKPTDLIDVVLSEDSGVTYAGQTLKVPLYALN